MSLRCRFARYCGQVDVTRARLIAGHWSPVCERHSGGSAESVYDVPIARVLYLLHFSEPLSGHAGHYLGYTDDLPARLNAHRAGRGARITRAATLNGISLTPIRLWRGDRHRERALKRQAHLDRLCPLCRPYGRAERLTKRVSSRRYPKTLNRNIAESLNGIAHADTGRAAIAVDLKVQVEV